MIKLLRNGLFVIFLFFPGITHSDDENLLIDRPEHITVEAEEAIEQGLVYLARNQNGEGYFTLGRGSSSYTTAISSLSGLAFLSQGNTVNHGKYRDSLRRLTTYLVGQVRPSGLIAGAEESRTMFSHAFSTTSFACIYGEIINPELEEIVKKIITDDIALIVDAQDDSGGWYYSPNDQLNEGSVTITQIQALRACRDAGFNVPYETVRKAILYITACQQEDGGIAYGSRSIGSQPALTAAAIAVMYNSGEYDSEIVDGCYRYLQAREQGRIENPDYFGNVNYHWFYENFYLSQVKWHIGGAAWNTYFPQLRDELLERRRAGGCWNGDFQGRIYGTALAVMILSMPYENIPLFMR